MVRSPHNLISPCPHISHPEHGITGEVLCLLNADSLKSVGVSTIGQRLAILKAVYQVKLAHNVPIDPDAYVPPCSSTQP